MDFIQAILSSGSSIPKSLLVKISSVLAAVGCCLAFGTVAWASNHGTTDRESPNALQVMVNAPLNDVVSAVEQVAAETVIYGTQSYQRERNLIGAHRMQNSTVFAPVTTPGAVVFYKVASGVLAPTNFKESADMGTLTVRYVVSRFDDKNASLRIDAVFIEDSKRRVHESDGSVEAAEFGEVRQRVEEIEAQHEMDRLEQERIAKERKEKQQELDLASRQEAAKRTEVPVSADLEKRVADLRKQAEVRVRASGTQLKTAPYRTAANIQALAPYTDVVILVVTPYWYGVQTADGHRGWVYHGEVESLP